VFHKALWSLEKHSRRGFLGYPLATVAFYGPDDQTATKVAVGIVPGEGAEANPLQPWFPNTRMRARTPGSRARSASSLRLTQQNRWSWSIASLAAPTRKASTTPRAPRAHCAHSGQIVTAGRDSHSVDSPSPISDRPSNIRLERPGFAGRSTGAFGGTECRPG
jgi:hypothetical protein